MSAATIATPKTGRILFMRGTILPNARPEWRGAEREKMQTGAAIPRPLQAGGWTSNLSKHPSSLCLSYKPKLHDRKKNNTNGDQRTCLGAAQVSGRNVAGCLCISLGCDVARNERQ